MIQGTFEIDETKLIEKLLPRFDMLVNVGANIGYYVCIAAKAGKHVIAVEPHPVNARLLLRNIKANGFESLCEVHQTALGETNDILELYGSGTAASLIEGWAGIAKESSMLVPVVTLDSLLAHRLEGKKTLLLMDVEGAELYVLKGARKTLLSPDKPTCVIEVSIDEHQPAGVKINPNLVETFALLISSGYRILTFDEEETELSLENFERIVSLQKNHLRTHNFLCIPS